MIQPLLEGRRSPPSPNRRAIEIGDERPVPASRFAGFDGLRALAALSVVGVHTTFTSGFTSRSGWGRYTSRLEIGVEVFFVISGFLLYRPFAAAHMAGRPGPSIGRFWIRRLKRILPAYWAAFLVITYVLHADHVGHTWNAPLVYLGFAQIYFPGYILSGILQAWSLCTEMTFYLFVPFWALALGGRRRRHPDTQLRLELAGLMLLTAASFVYRICVLESHTLLAACMPNWLPGFLDQFALGMLLAVLSAWAVETGREPAWLSHDLLPYLSWVLAAGAFIAVSNIGLPVAPLTGSGVGLSLLRQSLYGVFAFFLVLPAVFGPAERTVVRWFLTWRPIAFVGVVSYGVYLWHETWINEFFSWTGRRSFDVSWPELFAVVTALAVAAATVSYRLVERPFLRAGRRRAAPTLTGTVTATAAESMAAP
jgi:peptidoglycan/LPS O-acetylase OafA/YrhL